MSKSVLETVKTKLELNTYVMSCYLKQSDLYSEMKEHLSLLVDELEKCYSEIRDKEATIAEQCNIMFEYRQEVAVLTEIGD